MALQTTLSAWVRTARPFIVIGFALVQFLEHFENPGSGSRHVSRIIGLVLIIPGTLTNAVAMWEYRVAVRYLESERFHHVAGRPTLRQSAARRFSLDGRHVLPHRHSRFRPHHDDDGLALT